jgi:hypothetical protein
MRNVIFCAKILAVTEYLEEFPNIFRENINRNFCFNPMSLYLPQYVAYLLITSSAVATLDSGDGLCRLEYKRAAVTACYATNLAIKFSGFFV